MATDKMSMIRQIPMFSSLDSTELRFLAGMMWETDVPAGTILFREGDPGDRLCLIVEGEVSIIKAMGTPDERIVATRHAGDFFGEMAIIDPDGLRTASVVTITPLHLLEMARSDLNAMLNHRPTLAFEMMRVLSLRLDQSHNATIASLREKNEELTRAYEALKAAQAQLVEKERLEKELETARWIQHSILPASLPSLPGFDLGAFLEPARAVGGDLFDLFPLSDDELGVIIGDVSGKGVPAAIFMALTYSLLHAEAVRWPSPAQVLQATNRLLLGMNQAGMFVTVLYGVLDRRQRRFTYARAGHELPLHFDQAGQTRPVDHDLGQPLGLFGSPAMDEQSLVLEPGDLLLLYTDGATDLTNEQGQRLSRERLVTMVQASRSDCAQAVCDRTWAALSDYQAASPQFDDVALVAIHAQG
jgi:sigma-B regulation protein RsbU (phosphoserine phosphatase)